MKARPYLLLGRSQLAQLQTSLDGDLQYWRETWVPGLAAQVSTVELIDAGPAQSEAGEESKTHLRVVSETGELAAVLIADCGVIASLLLGFPAAEPEGVSEASLTQSLVEQALADLHCRLVGAAGAGLTVARGGTANIVADLVTGREVKRGVCRLAITLGDYRLTAFYPVSTLSQRVVMQPSEAAETTPVASVREALSGKTVSAHLVLGEAELELEALARLRVGDVIRLDKGLDDPLRLDIALSTTGFSGYLARCNDQFAFQVSGLVQR
ncbi:hypothetical protein FKG94_17085 [Exilibacterium tricleocarpae]|uniref:Flagellar motor switch protein FliN-like C-terminal domain-containing protein n=1 Tax=Exilibacterium tricleocarpae TaxID=2591008 RepID=A0A545T891_9GAMM|nr:FliM/FliN family flagellar motor switch protein [Exilibacterium tricleocarpae]TQV73418.1 hypothetical protein FKG94_17085 [Exilibacterium tricleocarpae]